MDEVMTIREVAQALKVAEKTAYAMAAEGEIPAFKVRTQWRVRRADFQAWLAKQVERTSAAGTALPTPELTKTVAADVMTTTPIPVHLPTMESSVFEQPERLPQEEMHQRFVSALGAGVIKVNTPYDAKPFEIDLAPPLPHRVRVYMYNATKPPGGRPLGEHKIQLIIPGKGRGERASFDHSDGRIVLLIGYAAEEDVFVLWDAGLYSDFAWSRNVQVKAETVIEASAGKLASQQRQLRPPTGRPIVETVIAAKSRRLTEAICRRMELTRERMLKD